MSGIPSVRGIDEQLVANSRSMFIARLQSCTISLSVETSLRPADVEASACLSMQWPQVLWHGLALAGSIVQHEILRPVAAVGCRLSQLILNADRRVRALGDGLKSLIDPVADLLSHLQFAQGALLECEIGIITPAPDALHARPLIIRAACSGLEVRALNSRATANRVMVSTHFSRSAFVSIFSGRHETVH